MFVWMDVESTNTIRYVFYPFVPSMYLLTLIKYFDTYWDYAYCLYSLPFLLMNPKIIIF